MHDLPESVSEWTQIRALKDASIAYACVGFWRTMTSTTIGRTVTRESDGIRGENHIASTVLKGIDFSFDRASFERTGLSHASNYGSVDEFEHRRTFQASNRRTRFGYDSLFSHSIWRRFVFLQCQNGAHALLRGSKSESSHSKSIGRFDESGSYARNFAKIRPKNGRLRNESCLNTKRNYKKNICKDGLTQPFGRETRLWLESMWFREGFRRSFRNPVHEMAAPFAKDEPQKHPLASIRIRNFVIAESPSDHHRRKHETKNNVYRKTRDLHYFKTTKAVFFMM